MRKALSWAVVAVLCMGAWACDDAQLVSPKKAGKRGEACQARNDCESDLACIMGVCSRNDFDIAAEAMQCDVIECATTEDCCGDLPTEAPPQCANVTSVCGQPSIPGCAEDTCVADSDCNGGTCGFGACSNGFDPCTVDTDCADTCDSFGQCFNTGFICTTDADCSGVCQGRVCDCDNPQFDPSDPICFDPDCQDVCTLRCNEEQCEPDDTCETNLDCPGGAPMCDMGRCIECATDADCDDGEACQEGFCDTPCSQNEECPLFHTCMDGDCVETGCTSDRQCVLAFGDMTAEDARLAKCLPSDEDDGAPVCKIPCENDGSCAEFQVCDQGFCKFIGCKDHEDCRAYFGLEDLNPDGDDLFVPMAVCR